MPSIFIVTTGEYSDYGVESIWSTRELAEAEAIRCRGDIEEREIDPDKITEDEPAEIAGTVATRITMARDGAVLGARATDLRSEPVVEALSHEIDHNWMRTPVLIIAIRGNNEMAAISKANERRATIIASGAWR